MAVQEETKIVEEWPEANDRQSRCGVTIQQDYSVSAAQVFMQPRRSRIGVLGVEVLYDWGKGTILEKGTTLLSDVESDLGKPPNQAAGNPTTPMKVVLHDPHMPYNPNFFTSYTCILSPYVSEARCRSDTLYRRRRLASYNIQWVRNMEYLNMPRKRLRNGRAKVKTGCRTCK